MYLRAIVVLCLSIVHSFSCYEETNARDNQILEYLKMDPNHVSEHEIVKIDLPARLHKRDLRLGTPLKIKALGMAIDLLLRPANSKFASDQTPVYFAHYEPQQGIIYYEKTDAMQNVGHLLEDRDHLASVVLGSDQFGRTTANGFLRSRRHNAPLVIRSLPEHVASGHLRNRRAIDDIADDFVNSTYHLVARLNEDSLLNKSINELYRAIPQRSWDPRYNNVPTGENANNENNEGRRDVLHPQVLIQIDSTFQHDLWARGMTSFLEYQLGFWNGVAMIYSTVSYPEIRINIAGFIIATDPFATPYIATNMMGTNTFHYERALEASSRFLFVNMQNVFPLESYDLAVTMTKFTMMDDNNNVALGYAYLDGACKVYPDAQRNNGVALRRDSGAFSGIITAAHEVGHLFGLQHDDSEVRSACAASPRFNMASRLPASNDASWFSKCSLDAFVKNYYAGNYACMYNVPQTTGRELPRLMPGKMASLAQQCAAHGYGPPCSLVNSPQDVCAQLWCTGNQGLCYYQGWGGAAPGTPCGSENDVETKVCLLSRCVSV